VVLAIVLLAALAPPARAAGPATVTLGGDATHDNRVTGAPEPPLGLRWATHLGAAVSYPVVADGRVFVTVRPQAGDGPYGTEVYAVDLATGRVVWSRPESGTYFWSALAYDSGRLVLVNFDGRVTGIAPSDGATLWTRQLSQYDFSTPPTPYGGSVYLTGIGSGETAYALRSSDGALEWSHTLPSGPGSPAVDAGTVYVSMVCRHAEALDRATGAVRWEHHGDCAGGGEATPALYGGRMYPLGDNGAIYDAASGTTVGAASFQGAVAFADGTAYAPWQGGILAADAATWAVRWHDTGDPATGVLTDPPLLSGGHAYVGSTAGYVAALRRSDGAVAWCAGTAGNPVAGTTGNVDRPDSGLGAGGGMLLVPAGGDLVAYGPGGVAPLACGSGGTGSGSGGGGASGAAPLGPTLTLRAGRTNVLAGRSVRLHGALARTAASPVGAGVTVQADPWPFDGHWQSAKRAVTGAGGRYSVRVRPLRNTRYRALAAGLVSGTPTVWADVGARVTRRRLAGRRFRETVLLTGPRSVRLRARRVHFYVVRAGRRVARHRAQARLRRVRPGRWTSAATLRYLRPARQTVVFACYRERTPDPWGRPSPLDPVCGRKRLRLAAPAAAADAAMAAALPAHAPRDVASRYEAR
jgi:outer membrane protein assembly factor BamB